VVFHDFKLQNDRNVRDNLQFVLRATGWKENPAMERRIDEVLDKVGMKTKGFKFPYQLSGGEQQRVSIARAIVKNPKIMFCDEPTGSLDEDNAKGILAVLQKLNEEYGTTIMLITHNTSISAIGDRIIKLNSGKVVDNVVNENKKRAKDIVCG
jgi:ABC-type ATPase involved in cell division